jgi:glycosyltransferase involved in cell wall biosynthesis
MRVMHVITPSHVSGAELQTIRAAREETRRGLDVLVVTKPHQHFVAVARAAGVDTVSSPIAGKLNARAVVVLLEEIRRFRPDILITSNTTASLWGSVAARAARVPCVAMVHGIGSAFCFRFAPACISVSHATAAAMIARGLREDRMRVVHNGLDLAPLLDGPVAEVPVPPGAFCIGTVAHLSEKKGLLELVEVAVRVPDAHFVIVGEGVLRQQLEEASRSRLSGRLHLLGFRDDVPALMRRFDVFCLPAHCEPFGLVYVEAMAAGRPVVAFESGGTPEVVVHGETGLLAPLLDVDEMAAHLRTLRDDVSMRWEFGRAGRERALREFTISRMVDLLVRVYADEIARQSPGRAR